MARTTEQLEKEYRHLAETLAAIGCIVQGSVFERKKGPGSRYQWTWKNKRQKTESITLTAEEYKWVRQAVLNDRKLKQALKRMRRLSERIFNQTFKSRGTRK